jgi:hypothetical protein
MELRSRLGADWTGLDLRPRGFTATGASSASRCSAPTARGSGVHLHPLRRRPPAAHSPTLPHSTKAAHTTSPRSPGRPTRSRQGSGAIPAPSTEHTTGERRRGRCFSCTPVMLPAAVSARPVQLMTSSAAEAEAGAVRGAAGAAVLHTGWPSGRAGGPLPNHQRCWGCSIAAASTGRADGCAPPPLSQIRIALEATFTPGSRGRAEQREGGPRRAAPRLSPGARRVRWIELAERGLARARASCRRWAGARGGPGRRARSTPAWATRL